MLSEALCESIIAMVWLLCRYPRYEQRIFIEIQLCLSITNREFATRYLYRTARNWENWPSGFYTRCRHIVVGVGINQSHLLIRFWLEHRLQGREVSDKRPTLSGSVRPLSCPGLILALRKHLGQLLAVPGIERPRSDEQIFHFLAGHGQTINSGLLTSARALLQK